MLPKRKILDMCAKIAHTSFMKLCSLKRRVRPLRARTFVGILVLSYVAFHALHGAQGVNGFLTEEHKQTKLRQQIQLTQERRMRLEHRIDLLTGKEIDEDLLEELAKHQLMMAKSHEIMMIP